MKFSIIFCLFWPFIYSQFSMGQEVASGKEGLYRPEFVVQSRVISYNPAANRWGSDRKNDKPNSYDINWSTADDFGREKLARLRIEDENFRALTDDLAELIGGAQLAQNLYNVKQLYPRIESIRFTLVVGEINESNAVRTVELKTGKKRLHLRVSMTIDPLPQQTFVLNGGDLIIPNAWEQLFAKSPGSTSSVYRYEWLDYRPTDETLTRAVLTLWDEHQKLEAEELEKQLDFIKKSNSIVDDLEKSRIFEVLTPPRK